MMGFVNARLNQHLLGFSARLSTKSYLLTSSMLPVSSLSKSSNLPNSHLLFAATGYLETIVAIRGGGEQFLPQIHNLFNMEPWLLTSFASCFGYAIWVICTKLASSTIDSSTINLVQLPIRVIVTVFTALRRRENTSNITLGSIMQTVGNLSLFGLVFTIAACIASVFATFLYSDALAKGGSGSAVAVITGCYPALSYVLSVITGLEEIHPIKVVGVALAIASCYCFAISK